MHRWMRVLACLLSCSVAAHAGSGEVPYTTPSPEARSDFEKARAMLEHSRGSGALELLRRAVTTDPKFALAHAYLGYYVPGPEGVRSLQQAASLSKALPEAERLYIEAMNARRQDKLERAAELYRQVGKLAPGEWRVPFELGNIQFAQRRWRPAAEAFGQALSLQRNCAAYNALGYALGMAEDFRGAVVSFLRCAELAPTEPNPLDSIGEANLAAGQLDKAEEAFRKAVSLSPQFYVAWYGIASTYFFRGQWQKGHELLAKALEASTNPALTPDIELYASWARLAAGDRAQAIASVREYGKRVQAAGGQAYVAQLLAESALLTEVDQPVEAIAAANQALERINALPLARSTASALKRRGLVRRVLAEAKAQRIPAAEKTVAALEAEVAATGGLASAQSDVHLARGVLRVAKKDLDGARVELKRCQLYGLPEWSFGLEAKPEDLYCVYQLSVVEEALGDAAEALVLKRTLRRRMSRDPVSLYLYWKLAAPEVVRTAKQ